MEKSMKKRSVIFLVCVGMMFLAACTSKPQTPAEGEQVAEGAEETAPEQEYEYPTENAGPVREESRLGYAMTYDPTVFTLDDTGEGMDVYTYHTSEMLDGPAYIIVQSCPDMDAKTLADGIALQSGQDGVAAQSTYFGADSLDTQCVSYEEEVNGITQAYAYYAVPKGDGALLVEIAGYVGMPAQIQAKFEEMAGTFALLQ